MSTTPTSNPETQRERALAALKENTVWYHTIDLAPGIETPGFIDWRGDADKILPKDMSGLRALDVGTFDGFWAFEMEKRGADVTAIDIEELSAAEWPAVNRERLTAEAERRDMELGRGFRLAHDVRGSSVKRVICNVYDLTPEAIGGQVDYLFLGALLLHLRDPVRALEAMHSALKPGGRFRAVECVSASTTILHPRTAVAKFEPLNSNFNWWRANMAGLKAFIRAAGFTDVDRVGRFYKPPGKQEMRTWMCSLAARRAPE
jgi:SAM-dependent methyltransferase